jgi:hypothetical protein
MATNPRNQDETLARITELAREAMAAQANFARQSIEIGRATLSSEVDATTAGRAWVDAVSREGARYWKEVAALGLDVAGSLVAISSRSMARVISDTRAASRTHTARPPSGSSSGTATGAATGAPTGDASGAATEGIVLSAASSDEPAPATGDPEVRRAAVTLHGRPGETATGTVTLANSHPRSRRVILSAGRLQPDTGRHVSLELRLDPDGVTIPAGADHDVRLEVDLAPEVVRPGERYVGVIEVTGGVEAVLDVAVVVEE